MHTLSTKSFSRKEQQDSGKRTQDQWGKKAIMSNNSLNKIHNIMSSRTRHKRGMFSPSQKHKNNYRYTNDEL